MARKNVQKKDKKPAKVASKTPKKAVEAKARPKPKVKAETAVKPAAKVKPAREPLKKAHKAAETVEVAKAPAVEALEAQPAPPLKPTGPRPLEGIRVLDLTYRLPGAAATMILANFGAEVIKIEEPGEGNPARSITPMIHGVGATFALFNRGKKSVAIKIGDKRGRAALMKMVAKADVLIEGFRPKEAQELNLHDEELRKHNEGLIHVALTGYGQSGPYANQAGHDINYLSLGGVLDLIGDADGPPVIPGVQIADIAGGALPAAIGTLLALRARERTGKGQMVDVAELDGVAALLANPLALYSATRRAPQRGKERLFGRYACYNVYPARNGRWVSVGALDPEHWRVLCKSLEREDLIVDHFTEGDRQQVVIAEFTRLFQKKEAHEWFEFFKDKDACVTVVHNVAEVVADEHLRTRQTFVSIEHPEGGVYEHIGVMPKLEATPGALGGPAPRLGEHTREVLKQAGITIKEVEALEEAGVIQ